MSLANVTVRDIHAKISRLFIYPVKSCAGIEVSEALLTDTGLAFDRSWMIVDAQGVFVTQREYPRLSLLRPHISSDELQLYAPGIQPLHIALKVEGDPVLVKIWDDEFLAIDMGDKAAQWLASVLSAASISTQHFNTNDFRLVRFNPAYRRVSSLQWTTGVQAFNQFSDGFPLLVLGEASQAELNMRLETAGHASVGIERFRPNVVLSGLQAHDEDHLNVMSVEAGLEGVLLKPVKPCPRCPIPNIDPLTAEISPYVGDTLQGYRKDDRVGGAVTFGMNVIVLAGVGVVLRVGQTVLADFDVD